MTTLLFTFITIITIFSPAGTGYYRTSAQQHPKLKEYLEENESEMRLIRYKDSEELLSLKLYQLDIINQSRRKNGAGPLKLDIHASRLANMTSLEGAQNRYISHWNMKGEKPYHRYAFAGGKDHITENIYYEEGSFVDGPQKKDPATLMKGGHDSFMAEKPPMDGHKKACINKYHTHVGIGYAIDGSTFSYYEEYIGRHLIFGAVPSELKVNEKSAIEFQTISKSLFPYFLVVYWDDFPKPMTVKELDKTGSYSDFTSTKALSYLPWELTAFKKGNGYSVPLKFDKPGLYYVQIYLKEGEVREPSSFNTAGLSPVSGVVIRVVK